MGKKILLVIEDTCLNAVVTRYLKTTMSDGSTVVSVNGMQAALAVMDEERTGFDIIATEAIYLSSFEEFAAAIRAKSPPHAKIVLYSDDGLTDRLSCYADATVSKLVEDSIHALAATIRQLPAN